MSPPNGMIVFYIPRDAVSPDEVFSRLGAERSFGPIAYVVPYVASLPDHVRVILAFFLSDFLELRRGHEAQNDFGVDDDPAVGLARAFRDACVRTRTVVGAIFTGEWQAYSLSMDHLDAFVGARDADSLLAQHLGLLYLSDEMVGRISPARRQFDSYRDELPDGPGLAIFNGSGATRW